MSASLSRAFAKATAGLHGEFATRRASRSSAASEIQSLRIGETALRKSDTENESEFAFFISWAAYSGALGYYQAALAAALAIKPVTLQRWATARHLPTAFLRRFYLDEIAKLVAARIALIESGGVRVALRLSAKSAAIPQGIAHGAGAAPEDAVTGRAARSFKAG